MNCNHVFRDSERCLRCGLTEVALLRAERSEALRSLEQAAAISRARYAEVTRLNGIIAACRAVLAARFTEAGLCPDPEGELCCAHDLEKALEG